MILKVHSKKKGLGLVINIHQAVVRKEEEFLFKEEGSDPPDAEDCTHTFGHHPTQSVALVTCYIKKSVGKSGQSEHMHIT